jgi:hypothetical protein
VAGSQPEENGSAVIAPETIVLQSLLGVCRRHVDLLRVSSALCQF